MDLESLLRGFLSDPDSDFPILHPSKTTASLIGIAVAISGNILISFALNCQKLAHKQIEEARDGKAEDERGRQDEPLTTSPTESEPLLLNSTGTPSNVRSYSAPNHSNITVAIPVNLPSPNTSPPRSLGRSSSNRNRLTPLANDSQMNRVDNTIPEEPSQANGRSPPQRTGGEGKADSRFPNGDDETEYLKSKLWWIGLLLLNVGEMGNFLSYAFAPASVVAPLGTFALIANCFFAPLMLKEQFRKRDLLGIAVAIVGAVTVVMASKTKDKQLDPAALFQAIKQIPFVVYAIVSILSMAILAVLSERPIGHRFVYIDLGVCALFGGFTVLATKGISTILSLEGLKIIWEPIIYPLVMVLLGTGIGQVRYLNRALMSFDSKIVVPTQFVFFNVSAITGSAILYRDFDNIPPHRFVVFIYGVATTFVGVLILARPDLSLSPQPTSDEEASVLNTPVTFRAHVNLPTPRVVRGNLPIVRHRGSRASMVLSPGYLLLTTSGSPSGAIIGALPIGSVGVQPDSGGGRRARSESRDTDVTATSSFPQPDWGSFGRDGSETVGGRRVTGRM